jgi:hypothetical protein
MAEMHVGVVVRPGVMPHIARAMAHPALARYRSHPRVRDRVIGFYRV